MALPLARLEWRVCLIKLPSEIDGDHAAQGDV